MRVLEEGGRGKGRGRGVVNKGRGREIVRERGRKRENWRGRERGGRGEGEGGKRGGKKKLDCAFLIIVWYNVLLYQILLLTSLSCCPPSISRQYGSQQSHQDKKEYMQ